MITIGQKELDDYDNKKKSLDFKKINYELNHQVIQKEFYDWLSLNSNEKMPEFQFPGIKNFNLDVLGLWDSFEDATRSAEWYFKLKKNEVVREHSGPTDFGKKFFSKTCLELSRLKGLGRAKLSRLSPNTKVPWHIHEKAVGNDRSINMHIPLKTNDKVLMLVLKNNKITKTSFKINSLYFFTSDVSHLHSVENNSDEVRWNIWINLHLIINGVVVNEEIYKQLMN